MTTETLTAREVRVPTVRPEVEALRRSYLELLKLCLCDLTGAATQTISWTGDRRAFSRSLEGEQQLQWRIDGRDWPLHALTMVGLRRLDSLQECVEAIVADGVEGDLIEAGSWRGGASILIRATLHTLAADDRTVWLADSFQGFPVPEAGAAHEDREIEADMSPLGYLAPSLEEVKAYFARFGLEQGVSFVPGFFEETIDSLRGHRWSLVRLDADTYKATKLTLEALYGGLAIGGYLISDDYAFLPACRRAIDEFRVEHAIAEPMEQIDYNGVRWRKQEQPASLSVESGGLHAPPTTTADPRRAVAAKQQHVPTDRELDLSDQLAALQAALAAAEHELAAIRRSPLARASSWLQARRKR